MMKVNDNREVVIIHPSGKLEVIYSSEKIGDHEACNILKDALPRAGKFSLYEWHNAQLEGGFQWRGMPARAWGFVSMASAGTSGELDLNPIASELRAASFKRSPDAAPVFGPVLIVVKP